MPGSIDSDSSLVIDVTQLSCLCISGAESLLCEARHTAKNIAQEQGQTGRRGRTIRESQRTADRWKVVLFECENVVWI